MSWCSVRVLHGTRSSVSNHPSNHPWRMLLCLDTFQTQGAVVRKRSSVRLKDTPKNIKNTPKNTPRIISSHYCISKWELFLFQTFRSWFWIIIGILDLDILDLGSVHKWRHINHIPHKMMTSFVNAPLAGFVIIVTSRCLVHFQDIN